MNFHFSFSIAMEQITKSFLESLGIPRNIWLLMDLYGLRTLSDLTSLDGDMVKDIEASVGNESFAAMVDWSSKEERMKYLGYDCKHLPAFKFKPFDLRKLMVVASAATDEVMAITRKKEQNLIKNSLGKRSATDSSTSVSSQTFTSGTTSGPDNSDDDIEFENASSQCVAKQMKPDTSNVVLNQELLSAKILEKVKELMAVTTFVGEIDPDCVEVSLVEDKQGGKTMFKAKLKCPACTTVVHLSFTKYLSPAMANFKRHITAKHLSKTEAAGIQPTIKDALQKQTEKAQQHDESNLAGVDLTKDTPDEENPKLCEKDGRNSNGS